MITRTDQLSLKKATFGDEEKQTKKGKKAKAKKGKGRKNKKGKKSPPKIPAASSTAPAVEKSKENGSVGKGKKRKVRAAEALEAKKPAVESPKIKNPKKEQEPVCVTPKTFARRYCPESGIGVHKWKGIVASFQEHVSPQLAAGTKTKAEVDFWRFAVQAHKDKGSPDDEKKLKIVFGEAARDFLQLLNSVPCPP